MTRSKEVKTKISFYSLLCYDSVIYGTLLEESSSGDRVAEDPAWADLDLRLVGTRLREIPLDASSAGSVVLAILVQQVTSFG